MDIKITKKRLFNILSYDWIKMILLAAAVIVVWSLLFTTTATRVTDGQSFYLVVYEGVYTKSPSANYDLLGKLKAPGSGNSGRAALSYDVLSLNVNQINSAGNYSASYMLSIRLSANEGDVIVLGGANEPYNDETNTMSQPQQLVTNRNLISLTALLESARKYTVTSGFITENEGGYTVNESAIEKYFREERASSTRNYRRTYTSEEKIAQGVKDEINRIEDVYLNYRSVSSAIEKAKDAGNDFLWYSEPVYVDNDGNKTVGETAAYGVDLTRLCESAPDGKPRLDDLWYTIDKNGNATTEGLVMAVFDYVNIQPDLEYESLAVINYIIRTYSGYGD